MTNQNYYNVTDWKIGNPYEDIGEVINSILEDIKNRQCQTDVNDGGKPGAVIFIPSGDYHLKTQVKIDVSYLRIQGSGHGFVSSSIRYNLPEEEWKSLHTVWPGGSRILNDLEISQDTAEREGAAFYIYREGSPRISSIEFSDFCIDGVHFVDDHSGIKNPENTYKNGKTGIFFGCAQDSCRINEMGFIYLEHAITTYISDALSIHDNFITECGNCIELRERGQASKITNNLIGAGFNGFSIYAENFGGLLITGNNIFPRGKSSVHLKGVTRSSVSSNRFHSFYPGMLILEGSCAENLIGSNHFLRDHEPWTPLQDVDNGLDDTYGIFHLSGNNNSIIGNHISESIAGKFLKPVGVKPVVIRLVSGSGNYIANNHIVTMTEREGQENEGSDSCYAAQIDALTATDVLVNMDVTAVLVEETSWHNYILDTAAEDEVILDSARNAFRPLQKFN